MKMDIDGKDDQNRKRSRDDLEDEQLNGFVSDSSEEKSPVAKKSKSDDSSHRKITPSLQTPIAVSTKLNATFTRRISMDESALSSQEVDHDVAKNVVEGNTSRFITPRSSVVNLSKLGLPNPPIKSDNANDNSIAKPNFKVLEVMSDSSFDGHDVMNEVSGEISSDDEEKADSYVNSIKSNKNDVEVEEAKTSSKSAKSRAFNVIKMMYTSLFYFMALFMTVLHSTDGSIRNVAFAPSHESSVYVSGGGFSGFWYTLGRLNSIDDPKSKDFYCYSAGCLAVVSVLNKFKMEDVREMAFDIQDQWKNGDITRYEVVETFVDSLLSCNMSNGTLCSHFGKENSSPLEDWSILGKMNIITTELKGAGLSVLQASVRKPNSVGELRKLLLQTSWIPYAVGGSLSLDGHADGAFSAFQHPRCKHHLGLTADVDLLFNVININLGREKVESLWNKGLADGL